MKNSRSKINKCLFITRTSPFIKSGSGVVAREFMNFFTEDEIIFLSEKHHKIQTPNSRFHYINTTPLKFKKGNRFLHWQRWLLIPTIVNKIINIIENQKCDKIICTYPDEVYLLAASIAAKKLSIPIYPYFHNLYYENKDNISALAAKLIQQKIFKQAPWVYVISGGILSELTPKYPETDFRILTNSTKVVKTINVNSSTNNLKKKVTFLGNINNSNIDALKFTLKALGNRDDVVITLITQVPLYILKKENLITKNTKIKNNLSNKEAMQELQSSNLLLLPHGFSGNLSEAEYRSLFPTKLIDYLKSNTPILAILPYDSFLYKFLQENKCAFTVTSKKDYEIFEILNKLSSNATEISYITSNSQKTLQKFSEDNVLGTLKNQIFVQRNP